MKLEKLKNKEELTETEFLEQYDVNKYFRPSVTVDMLIFTILNEEEKNYRKLPKKELNILMIKRSDHPHIGQWALPGGFVGEKESIDEAAVRKLKEETNIDAYMEQLYTWGELNRDPRTKVVSCSYMALVDNVSLDIRAGSDAEIVKWFSVETKLVKEQKIIEKNGYVEDNWIKVELASDEETLSAVIKISKRVDGKGAKVLKEVVENNGIAFDHAKIIEYGIQRLRNKIEYTDIAFNLMSEYFTLTELQQVYEIILDKELLKANFRRKIANMVIETNNIEKSAGHRPSKLYKFNYNWVEEAF